MRIIQISDLHLFEKKSSLLKGYNTYSEFTKVIDYITSNYSFELLVISGDISEDGSVEAYQILKDSIHSLLPKTIVMPGNHDNNSNLREVFSSNMKQSLSLNHVDFHFLDSTVINETSGEIPSKEIDELSKIISISQRSSLVFLHHHPYDTGYKWLDQYGLKNGQYFLKALEETGKVLGVFHGHIHSDFQNIENSFPIYSCPASSFTFKKKPEAEYVKDERGFNIIDINSSGELSVNQVLLTSF